MNYATKKNELGSFINELHEHGMFVGMNSADTMTGYVIAKNGEYTVAQTQQDKDAELRALASLNEAVAMYNDFARCARITALMEMGAKAGMEEFLRDQTIVGYAVKPKKDSEFMELESGVSIMLKPVDYIRVVCEREMPRIRDLVRIFTHKMTELETHKDTGVSYAGMSASYYQLLGALTEKSPVWGTPAKDLSKAKLAWMLEEIVKTMTFGVVDKMQSTDITYLQKYVFVATDTANKAGGITAKGAETVINGIFRAAYTRKNDLAYEWQTKDKVDTKAAESLVSNPVMAEPKAKSQATPKAGEVTSTVESAPAEKPKSTRKKSTTTKKSTTKKSEKVEVPAVSAGDNVTHSVLGDGVVSEVTKSTISVDFNGDIKPFQFPGAFADGFLVKK